MAKRLFVGSLPYSATNSQLEDLFAQAGTVTQVNVIVDKFSGQSKGFAFVEMATDEEAEKAIKAFNGYNLDGRAIVVNEARPREERSDRPGGFSANRSGGFSKNRNRGFSRSNKRW